MAPIYHSLTFKLLVPLMFCGVVVIALISGVTYYESEVTRVKHVEQQAMEFSESFLIATEVNSSPASIIRTTNSLGTYRGIEALFVIDGRDHHIMASNKNKYVGDGISDLPAIYHGALKPVLRDGGKFFAHADGGKYLFAYQSRILSADRKRTTPIIILMLLNSAGISAFLAEFRDSVMIFSALAFIGTLVLIYLLVGRILLKRIATIVRVIESSPDSVESRLCPEGAPDELGLLVKAYNQSLLSDHEHTKALVAANEELARQSRIDALTGLSNRGHFDEVLNDEWKRCVRHRHPMTLLMLDVDHFKAFNDRYGHPAGDSCLKTVATTLKRQLKRPGDLVARYGGEEFAIVLPYTADAGSVVGECCRKAIEKLTIDMGSENPPGHVTISVGVAIALPERTDQSPDRLLALADKALYQAKQNGRNQVLLLDSTTQSQAVSFGTS